MRGTGVEHLGNIRVLHHGQCLPLLFKTGDDLLGVHPHLDDLQRHAPPHRRLLVRHPHGAEPAFADLLAQLVRPDPVALLFRADGNAGGGAGGSDESFALGVAKKGVGPGGIDKQAPDFEVQLGVITAGFIEEGVAFGLRQLERTGEKIVGGRVHVRETRAKAGKKRTGRSTFIHAHFLPVSVATSASSWAASPVRSTEL